ncbi:MAG: peptidoglycan-binding protein [Clostridia bacterium]|nr:peptidoglycan-binding protein [Clostridia bacterium]
MKRIAMRLLAALLVLLMVPASAEYDYPADVILEVQQVLYQLGYRGDGFTSVLDEETISALYNYQLVNGLDPTGLPDDETLLLLRNGTGVTCYDYLTAIAGDYAASVPFEDGDSGPEIGRLQQALISLHYYAGPVDAVYGEETRRAVRLFQLANGLTVTGIADPACLIRLYEGTPIDHDLFLENAACAAGDSGSRVRLLQHALKALSCFEGDVTGIYGNETRLAVQRFQASHQLEATGEADSGTLRSLYAIYPELDFGLAEMRRGSSGSDVTGLQERLSMLGYYDAEITGFFGFSTETAVRLFQMGNGLEPTGVADGTVLSRIYADSAVTAAVAGDHLNGLLAKPDDETRARIAALARGLRGQSFTAGSEDLYSGFAFLQYVAVAAGLPLTEPDAFLSRASAQVGTASALAEGTLLALRRADTDTYLLAVCSGNGRIIYADMNENWVLEKSLADMTASEIRAWQ